MKSSGNSNRSSLKRKRSSNKGYTSDSEPPTPLRKLLITTKEEYISGSSPTANSRKNVKVYSDSYIKLPRQHQTSNELDHSFEPTSSTTPIHDVNIEVADNDSSDIGEDISDNLEGYEGDSDLEEAELGRVAQTTKSARSDLKRKRSVKVIDLVSNNGLST